MGKLLKGIAEKGNTLIGQISDGKEVLLRSKPTLGILVAGVDTAEVVEDPEKFSEEEFAKRLNEDYDRRKKEVVEDSSGYILFGPLASTSTRIAQSYAIFQKR